MLTGKRRAALRAEANSIDTILHIGKDGITEPVVKQAKDALAARELIKCRVLDSSMLTAREACDRLCGLTESEPVQVIGSRFVLYRENPDKKEKEIKLKVEARPTAQRKTGCESRSRSKPGKKTPVSNFRSAGVGESRPAGRRTSIPAKPGGDRRKPGRKTGR